MRTNIYTATSTLTVFTMSEGAGWHDRLVTYDERVFLKNSENTERYGHYHLQKGFRLSFPFYNRFGTGEMQKREGHFQSSIPNGNCLIQVFGILVQLIVSTLYLILSTTKPVDATVEK